MLKNYLKTALRNLLKNKFYTLIDIIGLAVGITAFLLLIQYVRFEWSYDNYHENKANIYRVESLFYSGKELVNDYATSAYGYATAMKEAFPEVVDFARIYLWNTEKVINYNGRKFREENVPLADSSFLTMFSFRMLKGDPKKALTEPNTMVITESAARKIFGTHEDPMGKIITASIYNEVYVCKVTGVLKDIPENSHFNFNYLISWKSISTRFLTIDRFWYQHSAYTYVLLRPGTDIKALENKFPAMSEKYKTEEALKELTWAIKLVPLEAIHLNQQKALELEVKGSRTSVWILLIIAVVVLIIAWINFINMSTARALGRAKEIGIRKVTGATRRQLIVQFLTESAIINITALIVMVICIEVFTAFFRVPMGYPISISFWGDPVFWIITVSVLIIGIILSGSYPAFMLSSVKPALVIAGKFGYSRRGVQIRKGLLIWQFITTVILIAGTLIVKQQIDYMRSQTLGAEINQTIILKAPVGSDYSDEKVYVFREELMKNKEIKGVTVSSSVPGSEVGMSLSNRRADDINSENRLYETLMTDYDFIDLYNLKLAAGRKFSREITTDIDAVIPNEESVKLFGFNNPEEAINQEVFLEGSQTRYKIIGVLKNYHHQSLHTELRPVLLCISPAYGWIPKYYYSVKVSTSDIGNTLSNIRRCWNNAFQESSFDYFLLDEYFDAQYKNDKQFEKVFSTFTLLAILIACLGLLGFVSYNTKQKTKEIGIRKVVGASVRDVLLLLLKEFIKWIIIANLIAWPAAYFLMNYWLKGFAFRIDIGLWVFLFAGIISLLIAVVTISFLAVKASVANPVDCLKYE